MQSLHADLKSEKPRARKDEEKFPGLKGKRVLVTGASTGIGAATAVAFSQNGACIGIHYHRSEEEAREVENKIRKAGQKSLLLRADLLDAKERDGLVKKFTAEFGGIDILVNNAGGILGVENFLSLREESWDQTFELNLKSAFFLTQEAIPHMIRQKSGKIINISSVAAKYGGSEQSLHYGAAKGALETLTVGLSRYLAPHKIMVNGVRGGFIDTPFHKKIGRTEASIQERIEMIPLKRAGTALDMARTVLFLASSAADFITGQIISVTGGD